MAGVLGRFPFATAAEKRLKQRKNCKKHCFLVVSLEKVAFREGTCQGNRKLRTDPAWLNLGNDDSISLKVVRLQTEQFLELFSRPLNFFALLRCEDIIAYYCLYRTRLF